MSWSFNKETMRTDDTEGIIPRVKVEEAASRLRDAGYRNEFELVRILAALSGLSKGEIRFNVQLARPIERMVEI